jgi:hypothetical protein
VLIFVDEFYGDDSRSQAYQIIPGLPSWQSWASRINAAMIAHGLRVFAVERALNALITHGMPWLPSQALGNVLTFSEWNPNPIGSYVPRV